MTEQITRGEIEDIIRNFAAESPEYRQALIDNPAEVLARQMGAEVPAGVTVKVVEETADTVYLVLPHTVAEGAELSDSDLEAVAGGGSKIGTADCSDSDGMLNTANNFEMSLV